MRDFYRMKFRQWKEVVVVDFIVVVIVVDCENVSSHEMRLSVAKTEDDLAFILAYSRIERIEVTTARKQTRGGRKQM